MLYVVYLASSPCDNYRVFNTAAGAKRSATCANRNLKHAADTDKYYVMSFSKFDREYLEIARRYVGPKEQIEVTNLMTGKKVMIDKDTPWCCNPASETYWSM